MSRLLKKRQNIILFESFIADYKSLVSIIILCDRCTVREMQYVFHGFKLLQLIISVEKYNLEKVCVF